MEEGDFRTAAGERVDGGGGEGVIIGRYVS